MITPPPPARDDLTGAQGLANARALRETGDIPRHVAIVMDGNGRWATRRFLPRVAGHKQGVEALRRCVKACADRGVAVLTVFAFSSENWRRSAEEIADLTGLMRFYLERELATLDKDSMGRFFPQADLTDIVRNMKHPDNASYNAIFTYPEGGAIEYVNALASAVRPSGIALGGAGVRAGHQHRRHLGRHCVGE